MDSSDTATIFEKQHHVYVPSASTAHIQTMVHVSCLRAKKAWIEERVGGWKETKESKRKCGSGKKVWDSMWSRVLGDALFPFCHVAFFLWPLISRSLGHPGMLYDHISLYPLSIQMSPLKRLKPKRAMPWYWFNYISMSLAIGNEPGGLENITRFQSDAFTGT